MKSISNLKQLHLLTFPPLKWGIPDSPADKSGTSFGGELKVFFLCVLTVCFCFLIIGTPTALAANQTLTEIKVSLGNSAGELKFVPNNLKFVAGEKYKILLDNPSPIKHYFTSKDFADASWTQKVQAGKVEVKGAIHELELKPSAEAEWVLVPMKPGTYELHCSIKGHAEAGMTGEILVASE